MTAPASSRPHGLPAKYMYEELLFQSSLGEGQYGSVWRCTDRRTGEVLACKQMNKKKHPKSVDRETNCFVRVQSHTHVVSLKQLYEDEENIYFVMELCNGGDLLPVICQSGGLSEQLSSGIFWQLVEAVQHCHARGVIHRDIKPENVLLNKAGPDGVPEVKLADFGLATWLKPGKLAQGWVGSPPYEAPEVIDLRPYDCSADIWSLGVVLYGMLSANWPSFLQGRKFNRKIDFQSSVWEPVSVQAKSLIIRMLASNPQERPSATEILQDPWFAMLLPEKFHAHHGGGCFHGGEESVEDPEGALHSAASLLPIDLLPPLGLHAPAVSPYQRATPVRDSSAPHGMPEVLVPRSYGAFGSWLEEEEGEQEGLSKDTAAAAAAAAARKEGKEAPMESAAPADADMMKGSPSSAWKALSMSRTNRSKLAMAPAPAPCSDSSTSSSPASPDAKPTGPQFSTRPASPQSPLPPPAVQYQAPAPADSRSFTKHIGKRLLQMVSETLASSPMCTKVIPSVSQVEAAAAGKAAGQREQEVKRPATATGRRPSTAGARRVTEFRAF